MIKKAFITLIIMLLSLNTFADEHYIDTTYFFNIENIDESYVRIINEDSYYEMRFKRKDYNLISYPYLQKFYNMDLKCEKHFIKDEAKLNPEHDCFYYLLGKGLLIPIEKYFPYDSKIKGISDKSTIMIDIAMLEDIRDSSSYSYKKWKKYKDKNTFDPANPRKGGSEEGWGQVVLYDAGIKTIKTSSYLSENTKKGLIEYCPENLLERLYYMTGPDYDKVTYDSLTPPWVEGKNDYGIGEYLDIEFKWPADEMQILNGFVDFTRMDLYEKNSRVKTVLIESENPKFSKEYQLEDIVRYTLITLPQKTQKIRMTIKEVYPGTKYKDTCLSSILVTNPNVPSYEEMSTKILNAMKNGVIDMRYDKSEPLPDFIKVVEK